MPEKTHTSCGKAFRINFLKTNLMVLYASTLSAEEIEDTKGVSESVNRRRTDNIMTQEKDKRTDNRLCMLVALIDIFVIKLFSYDFKDHTFMLQTSASTTPFRLYNG